MIFEAASRNNKIIADQAQKICEKIDSCAIPSRIVVCDDNKASHAMIGAIFKNRPINIKTCLNLKDSYKEFLSNNIVLYAINYKFGKGIHKYLPVTKFPIVFFSDDISDKNEVEAQGFKFILQSELFKLNDLILV